MNLDDLVDGKVNVDTLPVDNQEKQRKAEEESNVDLEAILNEESQTAQVARPVEPPKPEAIHVVATPSTPVLGYVTEEHPSAYAAKPIPGADMPEVVGQGHQLLKDYWKLALVSAAILSIYIALPKIFGIDVPGTRGSANPPITWFKKTLPQPVFAPVKPSIPAEPVQKPAPAEIAPAPALEAPAETVPVLEEPVLAAPAPSVPIMSLPPPPPPMQVNTPVVEADLPVSKKANSVPKKVTKQTPQQNRTPEPGSLEYAEQQMKNFTQNQ